MDKETLQALARAARTVASILQTTVDKMKIDAADQRKAVPIITINSLETQIAAWKAFALSIEHELNKDGN